MITETLQKTRMQLPNHVHKLKFKFEWKDVNLAQGKSDLRYENINNLKKREEANVINF